MKKLFAFVLAMMMAGVAAAATVNAVGARAFDYWTQTNSGAFAVCSRPGGDCVPLSTYIPPGRTVIATEIVAVGERLVLVVYWK